MGDLIELENGYYAEIVPENTHTQHGFLKGCVRIFPPEGTKSFNQHYVDVVDEASGKFKAGYKGELKEDGSPVDEAAYKKWWESLPKVKRLTPILNHFIRINQDTTKAEFIAKVQEIYRNDTLEGLEAITAQEVSPQFKQELLTASNERDFIKSGGKAKPRTALNRADQISVFFNYMAPVRMGNGRELRMGKEAQATLVDTVKTRLSEVATTEK